MFNTILKIFRAISNALGVEWAPLDLPMTRRLQTFAILAWVCFALTGEGFAIYLFIKLLYSQYWFLAIAYAVWMMNDIDICQRGGRRFECVRNWSWWRYYCDYFPISLAKTAELDPSKNYLFACFPHGLICSGTTGVFGANGSDFKKKFPGMTSHMITLAGHFLVPFFRDIILALGACASSQESLLYLLDKKKHQGHCVALMVGGAAEALNSHPGEYNLILSKRKGFIRVAMKSGAGLVPVFSFGEPDVFRPLSNPENSLLRRVQEKVREVTGISPMFPVGRGVFQYSFGVLPLRAPITVVIGAPIEVDRNLDPTDVEVDAVHAKFTKHLVDLFENEKSKYINDHENVHLVIT